MDEEEELDITLIGQEEEAPAIDTGDALMGAGQPMLTADSNVVAAVPGIENIRNPGAFNPANVEPVEPAGSELGYFQRLGEFAKSALNRDQGLFDVDRLGTAADDLLGSAMRNLTPAEDRRFANNEPFGKTFTDTFAITRPDGTKFYPDEVTSPAVTQAPPVESALGTTPSVALPLEMPTPSAQDQLGTAVSPFLQSPDTPSGLGGPLLRGFEMVNDAARGPNAPMGQDATRARLGGMTLNEYLNAPAGTPGVSGLRTDPQGRMITPSAQPPVDSAVPAAVAQPPVDALSSFERDSLARQQRIGGTGSFAGDSAAREARIAARPDFNEVRRDSDRRGGGLSQADARDLAQGMARGATEGERARALQIQSRLGLGQFEPERELTDLEKREIESRIRGREADIARGETKAGFSPRLIDVGGERAMELSPGYFQRIPKDTPEKTGLQATLENLQSDLDSGRLTQEEYDIATKNATDLYIGREKPKGQTSSSEFENIIKGDSAGDAPTVDATDAPQVATGRGQARRGRPIGTDDSTSQAPVRVNSQAEYDALAVGTPYIDSQGTETVKK
jgi:hypothetical protein